jgi:hypothetical protein
VRPSAFKNESPLRHLGDCHLELGDDGEGRDEARIVGNVVEKNAHKT